MSSTPTPFAVSSTMGACTTACSGLVGAALCRERDHELHAEVDDEGDPDRDGGAPEEREPEGPPRLGLPTVDPAHGEEHDGRAARARAPSR